MQQRDRWVPRYFGLLFLVALTVAGTRPTTATRSDAQIVVPTQGIEVEDIIGTWSGTWMDTVYDVGGSLDFTVSEAAGTWMASGEIGLESLGLGKQSGNANGTMTSNLIAFTFSAASVGSGNGSLQVDTGIASGAGTVTAPLSFGDFAYSGAVTGDVMGGGFLFTSPTGGSGVATLTRTSTPVDAATWSGVKDAFRED